MISQNNADYISWSQFLKGNYRKGVKRLESILNNPLQAADFIEDKAALAVIFGGHDKQTNGLLDVIRESRYADTMTSNYIASVADSDKGFVAASSYDVIKNVCLASSTIGQEIGRAFWDGNVNDVIEEADSAKSLDIIAANMKYATRESFEKLKPSNLSKISLAVGKNDGSVYSHLLGSEVELGVESVKYYNQYKNIASGSKLKGMGFKVIGFCADEDEGGNKIGFTLMSKYPIRFYYSSSYGSYSPTSDCERGYLGYDDYNSANPDMVKNYSWVPNTYVHKVMGVKQALHGEILDLARPSLRRWMYCYMGYVTSSYPTSSITKNSSSYQKFWTPSLRNIFGDAAQEKVGDKFWSDDRGEQYGWFKDFGNFKSSVLEPEKNYYFDISQIASPDSVTHTIQTESRTSGTVSIPNSIVTNSSYMAEKNAAALDASSSAGYFMSPTIKTDGTVSFGTLNRGSVENVGFGQTIYTCI